MPCGAAWEVPGSVGKQKEPVECMAQSLSIEVSMGRNGEAGGSLTKFRIG